MGKASRKKKNKKLTALFPEEVFRKGPVCIEQYGKYIRFSNNATEAEQLMFEKSQNEINKKLEEELEKNILVLQSLVAKYNPVELMHRAAYMILPLFMKYKSEDEFGVEEVNYFPAVEYLQYLIARTKPDDRQTKFSEKEWEVIWKQSVEIIKLTSSYLLTRKPLDSLSDEINELRFFIDQKRLTIRIDRYPIFFEDSLKTSLAPYEGWIKNNYGVGADGIIKGLCEINEYQKSGVIQRYQSFAESTEVIIKKLREKGFEVKEGGKSEEVEEIREVLKTEEFRDLYAASNEKARLTFTPAIFDITDVSILPKSVLSLLSVRPGENVYQSDEKEKDDLSPLSTSRLHYKPFLEFNDRYYYFYHSGLEDKISGIIEADLFAKFPNKVSVMAKKLSDYTESEVKDLLALVIKPSFIFQNLYYPNPDDQEKHSLAETDILMGVDDILFIIEVKSGGFSGGAERGAPKDIETKLGQLIIEGQRQSERVERYIKLNDEVAFYDQTGSKSELTIRKEKFRRIFRIIVTRENLGWVGAQIAILSILDPGLSKSFPWHVSLDDLRVIVDLFGDNEIQFIHFLEQRLRVSAETKLSQNDEIEHIALYNALNYYHNSLHKDITKITFASSFMREIDIYFMEKSGGGVPEKPKQKMPKGIEQLISSLKKCSFPGRFELGSMILSMNQTSRDSFQNALDNLDAGKKIGKERTFRMPFPDILYGFSVTNCSGKNWNEELLKSAAQMENSNCKRWIVLQLSKDLLNSVAKIELLTHGRYSEEEMIPAREYAEIRLREIIAKEKIGRNDDCPCGSGKKFKKCHGR